MNRQEIRALLEAHGMGKLVSSRRLAEILHVTIFTINNAKNSRKLSQLDRNTYDMTSVVEWLHDNQRYILPLCGEAASGK